MEKLLWCIHYDVSILKKGHIARSNCLGPTSQPADLAVEADQITLDSPKFGKLANKNGMETSQIWWCFMVFQCFSCVVLTEHQVLPNIPWLINAQTCVQLESKEAYLGDP